mmetsp:Transcript_58559/g.119786  ORF Transcript_58559/g.119786 Transcript_58559/m.119786 type:complete len:169 (-) Transcript_58559:67-573(-)
MLRGEERQVRMDLLEKTLVKLEKGVLTAHEQFDALKENTQHKVSKVRAKCKNAKSFRVVNAKATAAKGVAGRGVRKANSSSGERAEDQKGKSVQRSQYTKFRVGSSVVVMFDEVKNGKVCRQKSHLGTVTKKVSENERVVVFNDKSAFTLDLINLEEQGLAWLKTKRW